MLDLSFRAKVGDFGLARPIHDTSETRTSRVVGTSGYIPPEYYRGTITTRMDSFAFGVVSQLSLVHDCGDDGLVFRLEGVSSFHDSAKHFSM